VAALDVHFSEAIVLKGYVGKGSYMGLYMVYLYSDGEMLVLDVLDFRCRGCSLMIPTPSL
jgi:hypothetical protein